MSVIDDIRRRLVVSCQAYPGEPMLDPRTMTQVAQAAIAGGAAAIRAKGLDDLSQIRAAVKAPIIGLVKEGSTGVYITPTLESCLAVAGTGCEVVALDGTRRPRPDGRTLADTIATLKEHHPDIIAMADCGSAADAHAAEQAGADLIGTTLVGYTGERPKTSGPDWDEIDRILQAATRPVIVEGRIHSPADAAQAIRHGAHSVVVGTAITHPTTITSWFVQAIEED